MKNIIDRECRVCRHVVDKGEPHYFNFATGEYRHRACGLDQEGPREIGREKLVTPAHTPTPWRWEQDCYRPQDGVVVGANGQIIGRASRSLQEGNIAFLIRAINNYEALLEALQGCVSALALVNLPKQPSPEQEAAQRNLVSAAKRAYAAIAAATGEHLARVDA